jgi:hypothetical protein
MPSFRTISPIPLILALSMWIPQVAPAQDTSPGSPPPKSASHALRLSLLGTAVPIAAGAAIGFLGVSHHTQFDTYGTPYEASDNWGAKFGIAAISVGVFLGPTLGYVYVGRAGGLPIRLLAPVAGVAAALIPAAACDWGEDCALEVLATGFAVGCALAVADAGYDLLRLKSMVQRRTELTRHADLHLVPSYLKSADQPALAVQLRF